MGEVILLRGLDRSTCHLDITKCLTKHFEHHHQKEFALDPDRAAKFGQRMSTQYLIEEQKKRQNQISRMKVGKLCPWCPAPFTIITI